MTNGDGSLVTIDTTGNMDLIRASLEFTANRGQVIIVGVPPPEASLDVHLIKFMQVNVFKNRVFAGKNLTQQDWKNHSW